MPKVDLFLGGPAGRWVLGQVESEQVNQVITLEGGIHWPPEHFSIAQLCELHEIPFLLGDAKKLDYKPAKIGLSVHYPRLLSDELLAKYDRVYNIHPGYLPWGRGYYPVFWALWEQTLAGATLHQIDGGIDTGPIVEQRSVAIRVDDTGGSLYERVAQAERDLFSEWWPCIAAGEELPTWPQSEVPPTKPQRGEGTYHAKREFFDVKRNTINTTWFLGASKMLHLIRCLTFPGYTGAEVELGGKRFHLRLEEME